MKRPRLNRIAWVALLAFILAAALPAAAFFGPKGDSQEEKRADVLKKRDDMLAELYRYRPNLRNRLEKAPGYATFSSLSMKLMVTSSSRGYGVVVDNETGKETFMKVASYGAGVGAGIKDQRLVIIFKTREMMNRFVEQGWQFGVQTEARVAVEGEGAGMEMSGASSSGGTGGSVDIGAQTDQDGAVGAGARAQGTMEIYQFTETGVSVSATASGTKYWKDSKLN